MLFEMKDGPRFKVDAWRGDETHKPSFHAHWKWRGRYYWLLWFIGRRRR